jgi:hypothetical protein
MQLREYFCASNLVYRLTYLVVSLRSKWAAGKAGPSRTGAYPIAHKTWEGAHLFPTSFPFILICENPCNLWLLLISSIRAICGYSLSRQSVQSVATPYLVNPCNLWLLLISSIRAICGHSLSRQSVQSVARFPHPVCFLLNPIFLPSRFPSGFYSAKISQALWLVRFSG